MKLSTMRKIVWVLSRLLIPVVFIRFSYIDAERKVQRWVKEGKKIEEDKKKGGSL